MRTYTRVSPEEAAEMKELRDAGESPAYIAHKLERWPSTVARILDLDFRQRRVDYSWNYRLFGRLTEPPPHPYIDAWFRESDQDQQAKARQALRPDAMYKSMARLYRRERKVEGRCRDCTQPCVPNRASCQHHLDTAKARKAKCSRRGETEGANAISEVRCAGEEDNPRAKAGD